tara:strand:+ start:158 stop:610 length:453 start_codon:yes stop_codon:yes gene_type:complete
MNQMMMAIVLILGLASFNLYNQNQALSANNLAPEGVVQQQEEAMENLIKSYFLAFSNKDLDALEGMFSSEVILKDWDICAQGKEEVLLANKNIFDSVDTISADLKECYLDGLVAICIIQITINKEEVLKVVDVIKFNDQMKIREVSAYKQ